MKRLDLVFWISAILLTAGVLALGYLCRRYGPAYDIEELDVIKNALELIPYHVIAVAIVGVALLGVIAYFFHAVYVAFRVFISLLFVLVYWVGIIVLVEENGDVILPSNDPAPELVQELRFGEAGKFLVKADRVIVYSIDPTWFADGKRDEKL